MIKVAWLVELLKSDKLFNIYSKTKVRNFEKLCGSDIGFDVIMYTLDNLNRAKKKLAEFEDG